MRHRTGVTLVEVIVATGVLLAAGVVGVAVAAQTLDKNKLTMCSANMRRLAVGWATYAAENAGALPRATTGGSDAWVRSSDYGNTPAAITQGAIWQYVRRVGQYRCPAARYDYCVSYSINSNLRGELTGAVAQYAQIDDPGETMLMIEEYDNRGYNMNSFTVYPSTYLWWDTVAGNHAGGDNLSFADGHVEYWIWKDPDTLTYGGGHGCVDNGSVDLDLLGLVYYP